MALDGGTVNPPTGLAGEIADALEAAGQISAAQRSSAQCEDSLNPFCEGLASYLDPFVAGATPTVYGTLFDTSGLVHQADAYVAPWTYENTAKSDKPNCNDNTSLANARTVKAGAATSSWVTGTNTTPMGSKLITPSICQGQVFYSRITSNLPVNFDAAGIHVHLRSNRDRRCLAYIQWIGGQYKVYADHAGSYSAGIVITAGQLAAGVWLAIALQPAGGNLGAHAMYSLANSATAPTTGWTTLGWNGSVFTGVGGPLGYGYWHNANDVSGSHVMRVMAFDDSGMRVIDPAVDLTDATGAQG